MDHLFESAANFRGIMPWEWDALPWQKKAEVLAFFFEYNIRQAYEMEKAREEAEKKGGKKAHGDYTQWADFSAFRQG